MNELSVSNYMPCYSFDKATGEMKLGQYDRAQFMRELAEAEEEYRKMPVGNGTLTDQEVWELAQKYDPRDMTQEEYETFISHLVDKNVLSAKETYDIGLERVTLRPGSFRQCGFSVVPNLPSQELSVRTLKDANGNAIYWADLMLKWCNRGSEDGRIKAGALQKVSNILRRMDSAKSGVVF